MSLVMARMASEAEKRKDYMLLPDSQRGGGGECGERGQDHVEVQMCNKSAAIALPSTFFPRGSNWGNSSPPLVSHAGSMHSVTDANTPPYESEQWRRHDEQQWRRQQHQQQSQWQQWQL